MTENNFLVIDSQGTLGLYLYRSNTLHGSSTLIDKLEKAWYFYSIIGGRGHVKEYYLNIPRADGVCIAIPQQHLANEMKSVLKQAFSNQGTNYAALLKICPVLSPYFADYKPLFHAVERSDQAALEELCIGLFKQKESLLRTALSEACKLDKLEFVRYLVEEKGLKIDYQGERQCMPFERAARYDHVDILKYIISNCDDMNIKFIQLVLEKGHDELTGSLLKKIYELSPEKINALLIVTVSQYCYTTRDYQGFDFNRIMSTLLSYFSTHQQQVSIELMKRVIPYVSKLMFLAFKTFAETWTHEERGSILKEALHHRSKGLADIQWLAEILSIDWSLLDTAKQSNRPGYDFLCAAAGNMSPSILEFMSKIYPLDLAQMIREDNEEENAYSSDLPTLLACAVKGGSGQLKLIKHWFEDLGLKPSYACLERLYKTLEWPVGSSDIKSYLYQSLQTTSATHAHGLFTKPVSSQNQTAGLSCNASSEPRASEAHGLCI